MPQHNKISHKGRVTQIPIYLGKLLRMFVYMDDWKVIPMAAVIAGLVAFVACRNMFNTQEGTLTGSLALTCICIWNGFFNSIQVVCRERDIVKREHRSGMYISSYLMAHMIYQVFICMIQSVITVSVCKFAKMQFPANGIITPSFSVDMVITVFMVTYAADMISLCLSCLAKNTTAAMTLMPFMLIFELLFSGSFFSLGESAKPFTNLSIAKWGLSTFCCLADYNSLPMVTPWNQILKFQKYEVEGMYPVYEVAHYVEENNLRDEFLYFCGQNNANAEYAANAQTILGNWTNLAFFILLFAVCAVLILERVDHDKR